MLPAIEPGDWLVVNPRVAAWPRPGAVVVFREPLSDALAIKRVAAGPGERVRFADGYLTLADDEAWLTADASEAADGRRGLRAADRLDPIRPGAAGSARRARAVPVRAAAPVRAHRRASSAATA